MRIMFDAINSKAVNIPVNAVMVAGYVDGHYAWSDSDWARFPHAIKVRIAVFQATNDGIVGDCENGDMSPSGAVAWVRMRRLSGVEPTIYCSESSWNSVRAAFAAQNVREPQWWVAAYPGEGVFVPAGAVAHQYADMGLYDVSAVNDYWPGVDSEDDMAYAYYRKASTGDTAVLMPNCDFVGSPVPAGVTVTDVDDATWTDFVGRFAKNAAVAAAANAAAGLSLHVVVDSGA